jgi:hypothetical protein
MASKEAPSKLSPSTSGTSLAAAGKRARTASRLCNSRPPSASLSCAPSAIRCARWCATLRPTNPVAPQRTMSNSACFSTSDRICKQRASDSSRASQSLSDVAKSVVHSDRLQPWTTSLDFQNSTFLRDGSPKYPIKRAGLACDGAQRCTARARETDSVVERGQRDEGHAVGGSGYTTRVVRRFPEHSEILHARFSAPLLFVAIASLVQSTRGCISH